MFDHINASFIRGARKILGIPPDHHAAAKSKPSQPQFSYYCEDTDWPTIQAGLESGTVESWRTDDLGRRWYRTVKP